jgi:hypothetical protein
MTRSTDPHRPGEAERSTVERRNVLKWAAAMPAGAALVAVGTPGTAAAAPSPPGPDPWFGVRLPPGFDPEVPQVTIGTRGPVPALVPPGEGRHLEFAGERIRKDLEAIIGFSKQSRIRREVGNGQLWGRIAGLPSGTATIDWAVRQFRAAGIDDVHVQTFSQESGAALYLPESWEMRLLADGAFGAGTEDVVLASAMPLPPSKLPGGELTAPLVFVGTGRRSGLAGVDVRGKIAVQHVTPQGHSFFERAEVVAAARELMARGAVAVVNVMDQPGNMRQNDFSNLGGPAFNIGGRDGLFLENVLDRAEQAGVLDQVRLRLRLRTRTLSGAQAENGVAVIPGENSSEYIVIDAHADAWFDGANDNADGLAVMIALARHFAKPENRPGRTLIFLASAGHHTTGLSGPANYVVMNPTIAQEAVMALNVEHVAARNVVLERDVFEDGYRKWVADSGETPIVAGVDNEAPFLNDLLDQGVRRYGVNLVSQASPTQSGESGAFDDLPGASVMLIQSNVHYHSTGDVAELISTPGLERIARFLGYFIKEVSWAPRHKIMPAS